MSLSKAVNTSHQYPACLLCGGYSFKRLFSVGSTYIISCRRCGLTKTENFKIPVYQRYHRDENYQKDEWLYRNFFKKRVKNIQRYSPEPGKVLEVGCSTGLLLSLLKDKGWDVWGVEPSVSGEVARSRGIKLLRKDFETASLPKNYFDVVIFNHTLEHLENPFFILQKARKLLRKGGILSVDVPNFGSLSSKIMRDSWGYLTPGEHRWHFTAKTLRRLFIKSNLKVIYHETASGVFDYGNPIEGLIGKLIHARKSFLTDAATFPFAYLYSKIGLGANLTIIGKK